MDITDLNVEQLKALAYDTLQELEKNKINLNIIQNCIMKKTENKNDNNS